jgi:hypothetical protein
MHCKRCDYPLWDLAARVCPECGLGFSPVDYEFVVNSVRFMCPYCRQAYYGTGERGHLVPRRFNCVKCAKEVDEAEMVLLPTAGVSEVQTVGGAVAWRERHKKGVVPSFFRAIGQSAFVPHQLARYCGRTANPLEACWFGLIVASLSVLGGVGWCGALYAFEQGQRMGMQGGASDLAAIAWAGAKVTVVPVVGALIATVAWMLVAQLLLRAGNPRREEVDFARTAECFGYAWGACFLAAVPIAGIFLSPLAVCWVAVSVIIQLSVRHEVSAGRAVLAVLATPLGLFALAVLWTTLRSM